MSRFRTDERLELLRGVRLFSNCTRDELRRIESLTSVLELPRGTVLAEQGTIGHEFFVIAEGSASASRSGKRLARLDPGSFFGELALLDGGERTATVTADTEISLIVLSRSEFLSLQSSAPSVAYKSWDPDCAGSTSTSWTTGTPRWPRSNHRRTIGRWRWLTDHSLSASERQPDLGNVETSLLHWGGNGCLW
jgi:CRP/FNR family cyclic AMP-dependent transcriptional regulator